MAVQISGSTGITTPGLASAAMPSVAGSPVVESGSNSDGYWRRTADGTQECWGLVQFQNLGGFGDGTASNPYRTETNNWFYPVSFASYVRPSGISLGKNAGGSGAGSPWSVRTNTLALNTTYLPDVQIVGGDNDGSSCWASLHAYGDWA